ncbi:hypothetical protein FB45DRAFT_1065429 [Roridomyces roridus]|uniref:BTB domain-containing protein n=1 Tax=Roridomyces roridus TaxID=1738132 RepID=A0AAD7FAS2_9AGAR|nr:hypothetical protein FB45DRAFT_1065429 [Roridomyces roridus]
MYLTLPPPLLPLKRCTELWFEDCGLIVRAEDTLFRISGAQLAAHSAVFADMRGLKQPEDAEHMDGCPVVRLPDPAGEVEVFFKALFDPGFFTEYPALTNYRTLEGILSLSHKYEVPVLKKRALIHLGNAFQHYNPSKPRLTPSSIGQRPLDVHVLPNIIALCHQIDAPWIFVPACYQYCQTASAADIVRGYTDMSGSNQVLAPDVQIALHSAKTRLHTEKMAEFMDFILADGAGIAKCHNLDGFHACPGIRGRFRSATDLAKGQRLPGQMSAYLATWKIKGICGPCRTALERGAVAAEAKLNKDIPSLFGFQDRDELEKRRIQALE